MRPIVALDIETSGLDAATSRMRAFSLSFVGLNESRVGEDEETLLKELESLIDGLSDDAILVTWNGEEFDLPFLAQRFYGQGIPTRLRIKKRARAIGKYGKPLFSAKWGKLLHIDLAPLFRKTADDLGVVWSLKPVARRLLGVDPIEVDRTGDSIAGMDPSLLQAYVESDSEITYRLAEGIRHRTIPFDATDAAVPLLIPLVR